MKLNFTFNLNLITKYGKIKPIIGDNIPINGEKNIL